MVEIAILFWKIMLTLAAFVLMAAGLAFVPYCFKQARDAFRELFIDARPER